MMDESDIDIRLHLHLYLHSEFRHAPPRVHGSPEPHMVQGAPPSLIIR
jgi:hypothetical protein